MSLACTLTALREMILDMRDFPSCVDDRRVLLSQRFPTLTELECADLAKIPPERLNLYTESIFSSERSLLRAKFPISFALIKRAATRRGESVDFYELVRGLHAWRPWRTSAVPDLARNFAEFIEEQRPDWVRAEPLLSEALRLELAGMAVARSAEDRYGARQSMRLSSALDLPFETLLQLEGFVPRFVTFLKFDSNVVSLFHAVRAQREVPPSFEFEPRVSMGVCSRDTEFLVQWAEVSPPLYQSLEEMPRSEFFSLAELASLFWERLPGKYDESTAAKLLLSDLLALNSGGALLLRSRGGL